MVEPFLETNDLSTIDRKVIICLNKLLPTRIESVFIIEHLISRLNPTATKTKESIAQKKLEMLKDIDFLKQVKELEKTQNLTEIYIQKAIVGDANQQFRDQIDCTIDKYMQQFMAEQRGTWLERINQKSEQLRDMTKLDK